ncbi:MAG: TIR domain-containing protein [Cyanobacteria bacterium J06639_14]
MKDFFVSYNRNDKQWAEWIAWTLEDAGYSVVLQAWDFRPGGNFVLDMHRAAAETQKTIAVLSNTYLASAFTQPEWAAAFADDPESIKRKLIPIKVKECKPIGLLSQVVYVDLTQASEAEAKERLLDSLKERVKPDAKPDFPGDIETVEEPQSLAIPFPREVAKSRPSAVERVNQRKIQQLETRLSALEENRDAASTQLNFTTNAADRKNLERQIKAIEDEIAEVAQQLDGLRV